jgi:hypothetical protein
MLYMIHSRRRSRRPAAQRAAALVLLGLALVLPSLAVPRSARAADQEQKPGKDESGGLGAAVVKECLDAATATDPSRLEGSLAKWYFLEAGIKANAQIETQELLDLYGNKRKLSADYEEALKKVIDVRAQNEKYNRVHADLDFAKLDLSCYHYHQNQARNLTEAIAQKEKGTPASGAAAALASGNSIEDLREMLAASRGRTEGQDPQKLQAEVDRLQAESDGIGGIDVEGMAKARDKMSEIKKQLAPLNEQIKAQRKDFFQAEGQYRATAAALAIVRDCIQSRLADLKPKTDGLTGIWSLSYQDPTLGALNMGGALSLVIDSKSNAVNGHYMDGGRRYEVYGTRDPATGKASGSGQNETGTISWSGTIQKSSTGQFTGQGGVVYTSKDGGQGQGSWKSQ